MIKVQNEEHQQGGNLKIQASRQIPSMCYTPCTKILCDHTGSSGFLPPWIVEQCVVKGRFADEPNIAPIGVPVVQQLAHEYA